MGQEKIKKYLKEYSYLKSIQSLLYWDLETMMPSGAIEDRAQRLSYIQGKIHDHITCKKYKSLLKNFGKQKKTITEKKLYDELKWDLKIQESLPKKHVTELSRVQSIATHVWSKAKKENDWEIFKPHLQKLIELKRREVKYYDSKKPYDALIRLHDKEFNSTEITGLFNELKIGLMKLCKKVKEKKNFTSTKDLRPPFDLDSQKKLSEYVIGLCQLPSEYSRLDVSSHPFSINISPLDQRITTRYNINNLDSLGSTMHEIGHALYELNLPRQWEGTPFGEAISLSVHESQSRFWENIVGRSNGFAKFLHPKMKHLFPKAMKGVSSDDLFYIFNKSIPGLIRVESSELYYNFHIIIRFEIEEMIFNQGLKVNELPEIWNQKYKDYLGISPMTYAEGILQDSHWAGGAFGYFPTYTLGNLISGNLYFKAKKEIKNFKSYLENGQLQPIGEFLKNSIHIKGRSVSTKELFGKLEVKDYLNYLSEKFKV